MIYQKKEKDGSQTKSTDTEGRVYKPKAFEPDDTVAPLDEEEEPAFDDDSY